MNRANGATRTPTDLERAFLRVITRGYPLERQVETCLVSGWDDGYLGVLAVDGPPLEGIRNPLPGPTVSTDHDESPRLDSLFWTDERGMISSVEVTVYGTEQFSAVERMTFFVRAARAEPARLGYRIPPEGRHSG